MRVIAGFRGHFGMEQDGLLEHLGLLFVASVDEWQQAPGCVGGLAVVK